MDQMLKYLRTCNNLNKRIEKLQQKMKKTLSFHQQKLFCLLNMTEMVRLHGSVKEIWEGINESYVHPVTYQINHEKN
jgi:hypothetical protein